MAETITLRQARRIALAAQGFLDPAPTATPTIRHLRRVWRRTGLLQVDSVNVLQRAHYLPMFSRLGPYPTRLLDRASAQPPRELFEYWGHEASLLPVALHPLLRWRMAQSHEKVWGGVFQPVLQRPELIKWVRDEVRARGPVSAAELEQEVPPRTAEWGWNWSDTKRALEWLFRAGEVTCARRNGSFARLYDVPERVLPASILAAPTPAPADARRELVRRSAAALGVAAEVELRDYFRLPVAGFRQAVDELVEEGVLRPVRVAGWKPPAYLYQEARVPRVARLATLLSPFDPLIWERHRTQRLFGFHYRIEIYTPAHKRVHGYYVLPFLLGDALVARVDLKADRKTGLLRIPGAWLEPGQRAGEVADALAANLRGLAAWLGLVDVAAPEAGDLAAELRRALRVGRPALDAAVTVGG